MEYNTQYNAATGSYGGSNNPMSTDSAYQTANMAPETPDGGANPMNALIQALLTQQAGGGGQPGYPQQPYPQQPQGGGLLEMGLKKFAPKMLGAIGKWAGVGSGAAGGAGGILGGVGGASTGLGGLFGAGGLGGAAGGAMAALGPLALSAAGIKFGGEAIDKFMPGYRKGLNKATTGLFGKKAKNMLAPWKWRL
mgnify:CR=1 FL=1|jgi:hypothetical protein|tara:strand:- start:107 stop:688 length:582 start_codon:yes stop_codon:yes gene_type:complete